MSKEKPQKASAKPPCPACFKSANVRVFEDGSCECLRCHFGFTP